MSTAVVRTTPAPAAEVRVVIHHVPWELYERLRDLDDSPRLRMAYDHGRLELMCPSQAHEEHGDRFRILIYELSKGLGFPCKPLGATTWKRPEEAGKEADACFYLTNAARVRHKKIDLTVDPPPDLAIEIEMSEPGTDIESIYSTLGVPEIWRFDGQALRVLVRQDDGTYAERDRSTALPFLLLDDVLRLLREAEELDDDPRWGAEVARWVQAELVPRYRPPADQ